jgi:hypothetical protein
MENASLTGINTIMNNDEFYEEEYVPVEGHPDLVRDPASHAIINTSNNQYRNAVEAYRRARAEKEKIAQMEKDMVDVQNDISEIKDLLKQLIGKN